MVRKGNLVVFEGSSISETREVTPTKIGVYTYLINEIHSPNIPMRAGRFI